MYKKSIPILFLSLACFIQLGHSLFPHTHETEQHPLYELATSHLARRTFIGNLYKKVKDQELVASLTGHSPGSKAFARYRAIDEDMKKEVIDKIN